MQAASSSATGSASMTRRRGAGAVLRRPEVADAGARQGDGRQQARQRCSSAEQRPAARRAAGAAPRVASSASSIASLPTKPDSGGRPASTSVHDQERHAQEGQRRRDGAADQRAPARRPGWRPAGGRPRRRAAARPSPSSGGGGSTSTCARALDQFDQQEQRRGRQRGTRQVEQRAGRQRRQAEADGRDQRARRGDHAVAGQPRRAAASRACRWRRSASVARPPHDQHGAAEQRRVARRRPGKHSVHSRSIA